MAKKIQHPTPAMLADLRKVFQKHNWSGRPIGFGKDAIADDSDLCDDGSVPQWVTFQLPDGSSVTKKICP
jgi:hypothetical protein